MHFHRGRGGRVAEVKAEEARWRRSLIFSKHVSEELVVREKERKEAR